MSQRMRRSVSRGLCALALVAACVGAAGCRRPDSQHGESLADAPPEIVAVASRDEIAALPFHTQDGTPASLGGLQGKPVLMSFIYTRCAVPNMCPLTTTNVARVQQLLSDDERVSVKLVSVTFDPDYDTEEILRAYAKSHGADLGSWDFWRGSDADTEKLMATFNVWAKQAGSEYAHNMRSVILRPDGALSRVLRDSTWDAKETADHLRELARGRR